MPQSPSAPSPQRPGINSLSVKLTVSILLLMTLLGLSLYFIVLRSINDFAAEQIQRDLYAVSRDVYDIVDRNYTELLKSGNTDEKIERRLRQIDTQDTIEQFASDRHLKIILIHAQNKKIIMSTHPLQQTKKIIPQVQRHQTELHVDLDKKEYYGRQIFFSPWNWQIIILKNQVDYATLTNKVNRTYLGGFFVWLLITTLIIGYLHREFTTPIASIITSLKQQNHPDYRGIQEFEFLSHSIATMMRTLEKQVLEQQEQEKKQRQLEQKLHQAQKMEAIGLMAGGVAHDLNNILAGIVGYPQILLMRLPADNPMRTHIKAIQKSGHRAAAIVADLLTVMRGAANVREVVTLNTLIRDFFDSPEWHEIQAQYTTLTCTFALAEKIPNIPCSPVHVTKSLMNLTTNAAEAMSKPGTCTISTSAKTISGLESEKLHIAEGDYVLLSVQDTGTGIAEHHIHHIFDPFYTRKKMGRSGTGLGLTIIWNTMQDHHGTVTVQSSQQGTTFTLYFPSTDADITLSPKQVDINSIRGNEETILIIDDEEHVRHIGKEMLVELGYQPHSVESGEEAIAYLQNNQVDLLLLDMLMEPGMNGYQTYKKIIKEHPGQRAVIASGFSESSDLKKTQQLGAGAFIKKPYTIEQLGLAIYNEFNPK